LELPFLLIVVDSEVVADEREVERERERVKGLLDKQEPTSQMRHWDSNDHLEMENHRLKVVDNSLHPIDSGR
jgi:hypothetical protein